MHPGQKTVSGGSRISGKGRGWRMAEGHDGVGRGGVGPLPGKFLKFSS